MPEKHYGSARMEHKQDLINNTKFNNIPFKEIIDYLNNKLGTSYREKNKKTMSLITARFKDGYNVEDFKEVIDIKYIDWINDTKNKKYLRPETLFGNKFDSYLNQSKLNKTENKSSMKSNFCEKCGSTLLNGKCPDC